MGDNPLYINQGDTYTDPGATAIENVDGNLTNQIVTVNNVNTAVAGTYTVTYTVTDAAGNTAIPVVRTLNVLVLDTEAPAITLNGPATININQGDTYTDPGATATDNVDGDLTSSIVVSGTIDTNNPGTYTVTYTVNDAAGNAATPVVRTVNVLDTQAPVITLLGDNPINVNQGTTYNDPGATASDNVDGNISSNIVVTNTVDTTTAGTYTVTYTVTDAAGNQGSAIRTVNVINADAYGDGVMDDIDQCSETRQGVPVDESGCTLNPIYLDENGVTIKSYDWGEIGDTGEVNGVTYTVVSEDQLRTIINNGEDTSSICTSKVISMSGMFDDSIFNGDISNWDVSSVVNMSGMFDDSIFNGDISNWDVSSVYSIEYMFSNSIFNKDLSNWNVSNVYECAGFSNSTSQWTLPKPNFTNCNPN